MIHIQKIVYNWMSILLIQFCCVINSNGQVFLNDTTLFGGTSCILSSVYEVDTGYYVVGSRLAEGHGQNGWFLLGFIDTTGNASIVYTDYNAYTSQDVQSSQNSLFLNERNNFVYYYQNCDTSGCFPRIKEISPQGNLINDVNFSDFLDTLGLQLFAYNDMIQLSDSTYVLTVNTASGPDFGSNIYLHLNKNFQFLSYHQFFPQNSQWSYANALCIQLSNQNICYMIFDLKNDAPPYDDMASRIRFLELTPTGYIVKDHYFQDSQNTTIPLGLCKSIENTGYFFTYFDGFYNEDQDWEYTVALTKVDTNFQLVWKKTIDSLPYSSTSPYNFFPKIKPTNDGNYAVSGTFLQKIQIQTGESVYAIPSTALIKFTEDGDELWRRHLYFKPQDTNAVDHYIAIHDLIQTADDGFCMVGELFDKAAQQNGEWFQKGYIVKTNCLGFMGEAQAAVNHQLADNYEVKFYNSSMQAGSYTWYFGDGTSLSTDEYTDTIMHTYPSFGTYEGILIAHGCNGDNDTIQFVVEPKFHADPSIVTNGNGYFTLFPNPVLAGGDLFVYLNGLNPQDGAVLLTLYDLNGKPAEEMPLSYEEGTYQVNNTLAAGMYLVKLTQGGKVVQNGRLVVE